MSKPIPYRITQWSPGTEVLYKCPECGCNFDILGSYEKFCHNCGLELDWGVITHVNNQISNVYHDGCETKEEQDSVMFFIHQENKKITDKKPKYMEKFSKIERDRFKEQIAKFQEAMANQES